MHSRCEKKVVPTIPSFLFPTIIFRTSSRCFELGCQQTPEYGRRQAQPPQHLGKLCPAPSLSLTFLPPSSRSPSPRFETTFLTRSYCLVSHPTISQTFFLSPPSIAFDRNCFGVGRCSTAQPQATEKFALTPAGGRSKTQPIAKILLSHPHRLFACDQSRRKSTAGPSFAFARYTFAFASRIAR